jgi:hypothetical protein
VYIDGVRIVVGPRRPSPAAPLTDAATKAERLAAADRLRGAGRDALAGRDVLQDIREARNLDT